MKRRGETNPKIQEENLARTREGLVTQPRGGCLKERTAVSNGSRRSSENNAKWAFRFIKIVVVNDLAKDG